MIFLSTFCFAEKKYKQNPNFDVIGYFSGNEQTLDRYPIEKLSYIIYSFVHLDGNRLKIDNKQSESTIKYLVQLKKIYPDLKVMIALGGWGGCYTCSDVFSTVNGIEEFALSTKEMLEKYNLDGLDLDWEYPAIEGVPNHPYTPSDKHNFTMLIQKLRKQFGNKYELSFAAGGFDEFLNNSIEWEIVMPLVDRVNLMTYDLVNGYSKVTGHHTPLFSSKYQKVSVESSVNFLDSLDIPLEKIVIGAAFYSRVWKNVESINNGLFQSGEYFGSINYKSYSKYFKSEDGYVEYYDSTANAYYLYSPKMKTFVTYDNHKSIEAKVKFAINKGLGGIMFWQLAEDEIENGLLNTMYKTAFP